MKKTVQIMGPVWVNKGDRLMIAALQQELGEDYYLPLPVWLNTPASKMWSFRNISLMLLQQAKRSYQCAKHGKAEIILDCSGYQYGDPWSEIGKVLSMRLLMYQQFRAKGGRIIMMPMALGPFSKRTVASTAAGIFQLADLVFARDKVSYQHALDVGCPSSRLELAPDYSNAAAPIMPEAPELWANRVCIVPSTRMMDKTPEKTHSVYLDTLRSCIRQVRAHDLEPVLLVHQSEDLLLAQQLSASIEGGVMVVDPSPKEAKGIIASSRALIGSRFHALISALSQGTPAIGTGWTHKYQAIFAEYGCEEYLINRFESGPELEAQIARVLSGDSREALINTLKVNAEQQLTRTHEMFAKLKHCLNASA